MERINRWLARVKIAHKLILSSVVFALPIAVLLYYVTTGYNRGIRTCEREVAGTSGAGDMSRVCSMTSVGSNRGRTWRAGAVRLRKAIWRRSGSASMTLSQPCKAPKAQERRSWWTG